MTSIRKHYPLVEERVLAPAPRTGRRIWNRPARSHDELPRVSAHQVLVYRTGDQYLTDHGLRGPDDEAVLGAGSVTVVDCSTAVPVTVGTEVPSAETDGFTLQVAFHCTVTDPVAVVREGVTDVESRLLGYLRALPGLTDVTQEWPLDAGREVSRRLTARLIAYLEMEPPRIAGLSVSDPFLTVLTPGEFAEQRRRADATRRQAEEDKVAKAVLRERLRMEHELAQERQLHEQELDDLKRLYDRRTGAEEQHHTHSLKARANDFESTQALKHLDDFGVDPANTEILALQRGEITHSELAERQREYHRTRYEREQVDDERRWSRMTERRRLEAEELRADLEREDRIREGISGEHRAELTADREERRERWAAEREEQQRRHAEEREDLLAAQAERRRRADRQESINQELGRQMINRGLLDNAPIDARAFLERLGPGQGLVAEEAVAAAPQVAETPQLEDGAAASGAKAAGSARSDDPLAPGDGPQRGGRGEDVRGDRRRPHDGGRDAGDPGARPLTADDDLGEAGREERGR